MTADWGLVTGEYPPQRGGVADYSALIANRLADMGERVSVWAPRVRHAADADDGDVAVHRLQSGFGIRSLATLGRDVERRGAPRVWLVQYVPQAFGYRGMNLAFCVWLARRREPVWTVFHEVSFPFVSRQPARHRVLAAVTRIMAAVVARASERVFVTTPAWAPILRTVAPDAPAAEWVPVPSTIARVGDRQEARAIVRRYGGRSGRVIGHFGSCGPPIADQLAVAIPALLQRAPDASMMLLGDGCAALRRRLVDAFPGLAGRLWETGPLAARDISSHLLACDIMLQPYAEGVTTRRTSVMAALAHGVATVTTSGRLTEPLWQETGAVALARAGDPPALAAVASRLLGDPETRARIGTTGRSVYDACFDVRHTVAALGSRVRPDAVSVGR